MSKIGNRRYGFEALKEGAMETHGERLKRLKRDRLKAAALDTNDQQSLIEIEAQLRRTDPVYRKDHR